MSLDSTGASFAARRLEQALKTLIADKPEGRKITEVEEGETTNVVDLNILWRRGAATGSESLNRIWPRRA